MHFTEDDVRDQFDPTTYQRGADYFRRGKVHDVARNADLIEGSVSGSDGQRYTQRISVKPARRGIAFKGDCSCPMYSNCKHVVAVLLEQAQRHPNGANQTDDADADAADGNAVLPARLQEWLTMVNSLSLLGGGESAAGAAKKKAQAAQRYIYVLVPAIAAKRLDLLLCKARLRVSGAISTAAPVGDVQRLLTSPVAYATPDDLYAANLFKNMHSAANIYGGIGEASGKLGAQLLRNTLESNNLYWAPTRAALTAGQLLPLQAGDARVARLAWSALPDNPQTVGLGWTYADGSRIAALIPTDPPCYFDEASATLGELTLHEAVAALPWRALQSMLEHAPKVPLRDAPAMSRQMLAMGLGSLLPMPAPMQETVVRGVPAQPVLQLGSRPGPARRGTEWHDYAVLSFDYAGQLVARNPAAQVLQQTPQGLRRTERDTQAEANACELLSSRGFETPPPHAATALAPLPGALTLASETAWSKFAAIDLPRLQAQGWRIEKTADYRYDLSDIEDWYADVADGAVAGQSGSAWFDLELGIVVNQQRIPLLPLLLQLIREAPQNFNAAALANRDDAEQLITSLPDGPRVALPWGRIKPILTTLGELFFSDRIGDGVRLNELDASRLAELEHGLQLRWHGGERLRSLGNKLHQFSGITPVPAPAGLQAELRSYQSEGLAWMQFLREYQLAGILADDMGLGKTIQTLAHILVEKEAGRLTAPALVVAPTSLMGNWQAEAARFAPGLKVLLLHGKDRAEQFANIPNADLVLTTYALLPRDEEFLRAHQFHLLILDESQYIKNHRAKAAQTAALLPARHRLCLTGTPLQNHLGELWAQFHFLLPGLLGDEKRFNTDYRNPIEKAGNAERNALLVRRIKPFMLRRTKDKVATELPPKTEMLREVELTGAQRDLYETVRLAMDKKVRAEIEKKGVARSQIVILEALLKLRQVCCDPRLVKMNGGKISAAPSAKLVELLDMLEELRDEGRKVLVFSQFTSMLALIGAELDARGMPFALLTGDTVDRTAQVTAFQGGAVPLFLISLKAGGVGLNLTAADTVIHYDPWWNPAAENQATDRAWRIGQDKPVFVYKLIAKGTLEEKIQDMQRKKAGLADAILSEGHTEKMHITSDDLQAIFAPL